MVRDPGVVKIFALWRSENHVSIKGAVIPRFQRPLTTSEDPYVQLSVLSATPLMRGR